MIEGSQQHSSMRQQQHRAARLKQEQKKFFFFLFFIPDANEKRERRIKVIKEKVWTELTILQGIQFVFWVVEQHNIAVVPSPEDLDSTLPSKVSHKVKNKIKLMQNERTQNQIWKKKMKFLNSEDETCYEYNHGAVVFQTAGDPFRWN